jgi:cytoskeleton-associated protein 5
LTRLLINGLDKLGEQSEGEMISKNLNSSILRILETCNHTYIFCVLIDLMRKSRDYQQMPKLPTIVLKCLLKVSKIIEKLIDKLDMEKIFMSIHEYMLVINHENRS